MTFSSSLEPIDAIATGLARPKRSKKAVALSGSNPKRRDTSFTRVEPERRAGRDTRISANARPARRAGLVKDDDEEEVRRAGEADGDGSTAKAVFLCE
jgi:hypothetical protein